MMVVVFVLVMAISLGWAILAGVDYINGRTRWAAVSALLSAMAMVVALGVLGLGG